jgi:hypothetical protein
MVDRRIRPPNPDDGPWAEFAGQLYELYVKAGYPSLAALARRARLSETHTYNILRGQANPSWKPVETLIVALRGDPAEWESRWEQARRAYVEGHAGGKLAALPGVEDEDVLIPDEGVEDWKHRRRRNRRRRWRNRRTRRRLVAVLGLLLTAGVGLTIMGWLPGLPRQLSSAVTSRWAVTALIVTVVGGLAATRILARRGQSSARRREVMLKNVLGLAEERLTDTQGSTLLPTRFARRRVQPAQDTDGRRARRAGQRGYRHREGQDVHEMLDDGTTVRQLFETAGENLVLLGRAGMGKTTQLARLAHDLAKEALTQPDRPIPVLVNLGTYRGQPLDEWLVSEINRAYDIATDLIKVWLANDQLLPLLDELDGVPDHYRQECLERINEFRARCTGVVVTCRTRDYQLAATLKARLFAEILPPTRLDVQTYLLNHGDALADVRAALETDPSLWDLLRSPLVLTIIVRTYRDRSADELRQPGTTEQRRTRLFSAYVRRMLDHRPSRYLHHQTLYWLTWLARALTARGEQVFYLDRLDESWIPQEYWKLARTLPKQVLQFSMALLTWAWLAVAVALNALHASLTDVAWVLLFMLGASVTVHQNTPAPRPPSSEGGPSAGLLVIFLAQGDGPNPSVFENPAALVLIAATWAMATSTEGMLATGLIPVEQLRWTWRPVFRMALPGGIRTLTTAVFLWSGAVGILGVFFLFTAINLLIPGATKQPWVSFAGGMILFLHEIVGGLFEPSLQDRRPRPNEGIRRSLRFAMLHGGLGGLLVGVLIGPVLIMVLLPEVPPGHGWLIGALVAAAFGIARGFRYGGAACVYHWGIRMTLAWRGEAPVRYQYFLHDAEQRILLHRIGNGFTFPHRLLQEHLASHQDPEATADYR